jgi:nitric oxide reductase NorD protein
MGWDEALFGWLYRGARSLVRPRPTAEALARTAHLDDVSPRLAIVASALAGEAVKIRGADGLGGQSPGVLSLPRTLALGASREDGERAYLARVVLAVATVRLGLYAPRALDREETLAWTALAAPAVRREARAMLPGVDALLDEVAGWEIAARTDAASLAPREAALEARVREALGARGEARDVETFLRDLSALPTRRGSAVAGVGSWAPVGVRAEARGGAASAQRAMPAAALPGGTERRGKDRDHVRRIELAEDRTDENPLTHSFEKVHTAEEYKGGRKALDGSDEMGAHGDALDELDLQEVIRSAETTRSLYRADVMLDGAAGDLAAEADAPGGRVHRYHEWDERHRQWRDAWCTVRANAAAETLDASRAAELVKRVLHRHRREVRGLRAEFERIELGRAWRNRQPDGPDVDTDAMVERYACLRAGHSPPDRLHASRRKHGRDTATIILLDASLSSDGWVGGRRVMDVARDSVLVLGEALAGLHDEVGVAAFHSNTRRDCRFAVIKGMTDPWESSWRRLASVAPTGYTRIGPALRHASWILSRARARRRLLLVVSDGRPTDYDRYEGRYGVADVAMAVREAHDVGVQVFTLAIDAQSRAHLPAMFGATRFAVLPRPDDLVAAMASVYGRLLR